MPAPAKIPPRSIDGVLDGALLDVGAGGPTNKSSSLLVVLLAGFAGPVVGNGVIVGFVCDLIPVTDILNYLILPTPVVLSNPPPGFNY
ncbi:MAG: hypothetical protein HY094_08565 [Candidatus Melainabacteria bacterium]|nr:hypothetical protein [Candidatus Melainabacteria bacterium]